MPVDTVIDLSHYQDGADLVRARDAGIEAVIAKATQGATYVDAAFDSHRANTALAGLLWGSYHFGTGDDVQSQVDNYLSIASPGDGDLVCLDFESNPHGPSMTLAQARDFVALCHDALGRYPLIYSGHTLKEALGNQPDALLSCCPLWLAQYGSRAVLPPGWDAYTLWQFTDGSIGVAPLPAPVPGVGRCDRDRYAGTSADLQAQWPFVVT
jgi:lysozyme